MPQQAIAPARQHERLADLRIHLRQAPRQAPNIEMAVLEAFRAVKAFVCRAGEPLRHGQGRLVSDRRRRDLARSRCFAEEQFARAAWNDRHRVASSNTHCACESVSRVRLPSCVRLGVGGFAMDASISPGDAGGAPTGAMPTRKARSLSAVTAIDRSPVRTTKSGAAILVAACTRPFDTIATPARCRAARAG